MSKYNKETLQKLDKFKLVRLLEKEGIEASVHQSKIELIRLLTLVKKANTPTTIKLAENTKISSNRRKYGIIALISLVVLIFSLYWFNNMFQQNVDFLFSVLKKSQQTTNKDYEPSIYEKGGKTYVVYDYPLTEVRALYDPSCKRPECELESYFKQIKHYISPLVKFKEVDFNSSAGKKLAEKYNLNLLPVFLFDTNLEKTETFDITKRNLDKVQDKYILQVPPTRLIELPSLTNARKYQEATNKEKEVILIEYTGPSCKLCFDSYMANNGVIERLGGRVTRIIKYFNTQQADLPASIALECAGQQDKFPEYYDALFTRQAEWSMETETNTRNIFLRYATEFGMNRNLFNSCLNDETVHQLVINHFNEAGRLGISAAPTTIINNQVLVGVYPEESLHVIVQDILRN